MRLGFTGESVAKLQARLIELSFLPEGSNDRDFGIMTELALKRFQLSNGLENDGVAGAVTLAALYPSSIKTDRTVPLTVAPHPVCSPTIWTLDNIVLSESVIPLSSFTWAEATHAGTRMPESQDILDGMIRIATEAQEARDLIQRPFVITSWYRTPSANAAAGGASDSRHLYGDAMDFWCEGVDGNQLYDWLDPWWRGGLGRYSAHPALVHIDARGEVARWIL